MGAGKEEMVVAVLLHIEGGREAEMKFLYSYVRARKMRNKCVEKYHKIHYFLKYTFYEF